MKDRHYIHSHPAMPGINPIIPAAAGLARMRQASSDPITQEQAERDLDQQVMSVGMDDLSALEGMLAIQAHMLHGIFTQAVERCAGDASDAQIKLHSAIALKSQSYCRQTIAALAKIKRSGDYNRNWFADSPKVKNELKRSYYSAPYYPPAYKEPSHAPLDTGRTQQTGSADARAAAMDERRRQNRGG